MRPFTGGLREVNWCIVEQPKFVEEGKRSFEGGPLRFFHTLGACLGEIPCDAVLLSGVAQYLDEPHGLLGEVARAGFRYILIDRTPFVLGRSSDRLTVQRVPPAIYDASYPCWFFEENRFLEHFRERYEILAEFPGKDRARIPSAFKGFLMARRG
jgi:putative methyltransferase (TIGR04325 family)